MLFDHPKLTPAGRLEAIERLFASVARREGDVPELGHVPVDALEAYGAFETPIRHLIESSGAATKDRTLLRQLHKIERELNALPDALMNGMRAEPNEDWPDFYRRLIRLHNLMAEIDGDTDPEEYAANLRRMVVLADTVSRHSRVKMEAAGCFTMLLLQIELERQHPRRPQRKRRRNARRRSTAKTRKSGT